MQQIDSINEYELATTSDGRPVVVPGAEGEEVCLAVDRRHLQLVELHRPARQVMEAGEAAGWNPPAFAPRGGSEEVLAFGDRDGVPWYVTPHKDGELLEAYVVRRGPLSAATAFSLVLQVLDEVIEEIAPVGGLVGLGLERLVVCLEDENQLRLRILDRGRLQLRYEEEAEAEARLVREIARVTCRLLVGMSRPGLHPDRVAVLHTLPGRMKLSLRVCLGAPGELTRSLAEFRAEVQEALQAQSRDLLGRDKKRHMTALENMVPHSCLRERLFPSPKNLEVLSERYVLEETGGDRHPFSLPVTEGRTGRRLRLQLLPPPGMLSSLSAVALPPALGRLDGGAHPNLLRCAGAWECPDFAFQVEERGQELPLPHVLRERGMLKPVEVRLLLTQVKATLDQAASAGDLVPDLRPANLLLRVKARVTDRELEKLSHRHLEAWPEFLVVARCHPTLSSLFAPPLLRDGATVMPARQFAALTVALFSGRRTWSEELKVPAEHLTPELQNWIEEVHARLLAAATLPEPEEILASLEKLVPLPTFSEEDQSDLATGWASGSKEALRERLRGHHPDGEPMESMGSVSDFDEDMDSPEQAAGEHGALSLPKAESASQPPARKSFLRGLWA